jgi:hypothetical protein
MREHLFKIVLPALLILQSLPTSASAGDGCCAHCGCNTHCRKVCKLVEEEKEVEIVCWGSKCEDWCIPGPSCPGCKHCKMVCVDCEKNCDCHEPHATPKKFVWRDWVPGCASVHTKKKLMKKVVKEKVKSFKWVVEDLCPECTQCCRQANASLVKNAPLNAAIPLPPTDDAPVTETPTRTTKRPANPLFTWADTNASSGR